MKRYKRFFEDDNLIEQIKLYFGKIYPEILMSHPDSMLSKKEVYNLYNKSNLKALKWIQSYPYKVNDYITNVSQFLKCNVRERECYANALELCKQFKDVQLCIGYYFDTMGKDLQQNLDYVKSIQKTGDFLYLTHLGGYPHAFNMYKNKILDVTSKLNKVSQKDVYYFYKIEDSSKFKNEFELMKYIDTYTDKIKLELTL